jgi:hypothetical protein
MITGYIPFLNSAVVWILQLQNADGSEASKIVA